MTSLARTQPLLKQRGERPAHLPDPLCALPAPARPTHAMSSASAMHVLERRLWPRPRQWRQEEKQKSCDDAVDHNQVGGVIGHGVDEQEGADGKEPGPVRGKGTDKKKVARPVGGKGTGKKNGTLISPEGMKPKTESPRASTPRNEF